jgi:lipopolysaccharide transport system ATP-binding protein
MSNDNEILVKVDGVSKKFCRDLKKSLWYGVKDVAHELLPFSSNKEPGTKNTEPGLRPGEFWANKDISFELRRGECLGLIGHNGAGKTTLLKMLNGLIKPDLGKIEIHGRVGALIALGAGFNPILTGRENIYVNGSILGLSKEEIDEKIEDIINFSEIPDFIDAPVQSYSSGMQVRLGFAVATALNPDVLILDEVLAVGDRVFRTKCMKRISKILENAAVILVSHNEAQIKQKCDRVLYLKGGSTIFNGLTDEGLRIYSKENILTQQKTLLRDGPMISMNITNVEYSGMQNSELLATLEMNFDYSDEIDYAVITIESDTAIPVAQSIPLNLPYIAKKGLNIVKISISSVSLSSGHYYLSVLISSDGGKRMIGNLLFGASFNVISGEPLWCAYQPKVLFT